MRNTPAQAPRRLARRSRVTRRLIPLVVVATAALGAGVVAGASYEPAERRSAERFVAAWTRADYGAMYELLDDASRERVGREAFAEAYKRAAATATVERVESAGRLTGTGGQYRVPLRVRTRSFGTIRGTLDFQVRSSGSNQSGIAWNRQLVFPGLEPGETVNRTTEMPPRAALEARNGQVIAQGAARTGQLGALSTEIVGSVGPIPADQRAAYTARGYPKDAQVGLSGLERQFEQRLAGTFGGSLRLGDRVITTAQARQAGAVRTSIDPGLEAAAVNALAGRSGGIAVMRPGTGEVLALAGFGYSASQPPASTFKIITLAGALDAGIVKPSDTYPVQTETTLSGVSLRNAHGEACGGSLIVTFAKSCNSVFAPMGAELGAERLVAAAEKFGFNRTSDIPDAPSGAIPAPGEIGDDLALGSTAIGQGQTTATPLRMAEVAGAIANDGELVSPTFLRGAEGQRSRATSERTARFIRKAMVKTVKSGTGQAAAVKGVKVAGKTGTAELTTTVRDPDSPQAPEDSDAEDTTAWFVAFAPANRPKIAVAVMLIGQGEGGATAAPAAQGVLAAGVKG